MTTFASVETFTFFPFRIPRIVFRSSPVSFVVFRNPRALISPIKLSLGNDSPTVVVNAVIIDVFDEIAPVLIEAGHFLPDTIMQAAFDWHPAQQTPRMGLAFLSVGSERLDFGMLLIAAHHISERNDIGSRELAKAYLRGMGIVEPMQKFRDIPPKIHGIAMAAYYGGRAECHIRRWPMPVVPVDLTSEYPSVDALLGIWDTLTAERLSIEDATDDIRALLEDVSLERLFQPAFWKQFNFYARIVPDGNVLPVRSVYYDKSGTCNIGLNSLHWKQPMWVAGPDLIASVLLSRRVPNVQEAFRIVPNGKQSGLRSIELRGAIAIDPTKEDFFTRVIEYRKRNKADDRPEYFLKILANSASYGTYLELNPVKSDPGNRPKITVHSGDRIFEQSAPDTTEQPGSFYFPMVVAIVRSIVDYWLCWDFYFPRQ